MDKSSQINSLDKELPHFIHIGNSCNNNCVFCSEKMWGKPQNRSLKDIKREIILQKGRKVNFMGQEPTLRKDFLKIIKYAKNAGVRSVAFTTNGRMLSYFKFCEEIKESAVDYFVISLNGHNPDVHDSLTRVPGSFEQTLAGMKNASFLKIPFTVNVAIVQRNEKYLKEIAALLRPFSPLSINFLFLLPIKQILNKRIVPKLSKIAPKIKDLIDSYSDLKIKLVGFPLCFFAGYEGNAAPYRESRRFFKKISLCRLCRYKKVCGVFEGYLKIYGEEEFINLKFPKNE